MPTVKSDFVNLSLYEGAPVIDAISYSARIQNVSMYDPETGFIGNAIPTGVPYAVLSDSNSVYTILSIADGGIYLETGLDQNSITWSYGEGNACNVVYDYTSEVVVDSVSGQILITGTGLNSMSLMGSMSNGTEPFISQPYQNGLNIESASADGTSLICSFRAFGAWPFPEIQQSLAYYASDPLIAGDATDYNLNFKVNFIDGALAESTWMTTWTKIGTPTISTLTSMGSDQWASSQFVNSPYAQYCGGFTNDNCYQIDDASLANWIYEWNTPEVGEPLMVQIIASCPPYSNFQPDRILFNVGTRGVDGFRIGVGDYNGGFYTQSIFLEWEYAEEEFGPRVGTRRIYRDIPTFNHPMVITAVRTGADSTGAEWRLVMNENENWFPEYGNDWPVLYWGFQFNGFLGCYHSTPPAWDSATVYTFDDRVLYGGNAYYSLTEVNENNVPTVGGDANWVQDVVLNAWNGNIWAARWVNDYGAPFTETLVNSNYAAFYATLQNNTVAAALYPCLSTFYYSQYFDCTYDDVTGYVTLGGVDTWWQTPSYLVGTSGATHEVVSQVNTTTIEIAPGLAVTEIFNGTTEATPTTGMIVTLDSSRGDGGSIVTSTTPVTISLFEPSITAWMNPSTDVVIAPITQTLPPTVPTVANGGLFDWQTGTTAPPLVYHPANGSAGPGVSLRCNAAYPSSDWSGSYHGWDENGYGIWDCHGWAPPAESCTSVLFAANTLYKVRGGPFAHGMGVMIQSFQANFITFSEYTGGGNPGPGEWKYIDTQTILVRGPDPWPSWMTNLWSFGSVAPVRQIAYSTSSATTLTYYSGGFGSGLVYWDYDSENGYGPLGTRTFLINNGNVNWAAITVFGADPMGSAL